VSVLIGRTVSAYTAFWVFICKGYVTAQKSCFHTTVRNEGAGT
jgi:hypothetical protein